MQYITIQVTHSFFQIYFDNLKKESQFLLEKCFYYRPFDTMSKVYALLDRMFNTDMVNTQSFMTA